MKHPLPLALCLFVCGFGLASPILAAPSRPAVTASAHCKSVNQRERFNKADASLNAVYGQLMKQLAATEQDQLRVEQRAWLKRRDANAGMLTDNEPSQEPISWEAKADFTEARVKELRARLKPSGAPVATASATANYTGSYTFTGRKPPIAFGFDVAQTGDTANISFNGCRVDGQGADPQGEGTGQINAAGVLTFTFTDTFENKGEGTLERKKGGYLLNLNATEVKETRPLRLYGEMLMKKEAKPKSMQ